MRRISIIILIAFLLFPLFSKGQKHAQQINGLDELEAQIKLSLKNHNIKGAAMAWIQQDKVIWEGCYGWAGKDKSLAVDEKTIFRLGSISKVFTAIGILQLREQGLLMLGDSVSKFIQNPSFSFTIRDLLSHHSGLPSDYLKDFFSEDSTDFKKLEALLVKLSPSHPPRTSFAYSNLGYDLLGIILEKVSGESFESYMQKHVFSQLGMSQSFFLPSTKGNIHISPSFKADGSPLEEPLLRDLPAIMLHSSLSDMKRFIRHFIQMQNTDKLSGSLLSQSSFELMTQSQNEDIWLDFDRDMGLGLFLYGKFSQWEYLGGAYGHAGDTYLFHSQISFFPKMHAGLVILTNSEMGSAATEEIEWLLATHFAKKIFGLTYVNNSKWSHGRMRGKSRPLKEYQGTYALGTEAIEIKLKNGKLNYRTGEGKGVLIHDGREGLFVNQEKGMRNKQRFEGSAVFFHEKGGRKVITAIGKQGESLVGIEENIHPIPQSWKSYLGNYAAVEAKDEFFLSDLSLEKEGDFLVLKASVFGRKPKKKIDYQPNKRA